MVHIDTSTRPTATRLSVQGELDMATVGALDEALTRAARSGGPVEVDLGGVDFIDGSGLSVLMNAESRARLMGQELTIVAASRNVRRLIDVTDTAGSVSRMSGPDGLPAPRS